MAKLTAKAVAAAQHPGTTKGHRLLADGDGLYLQVTKAGGRSWLLRFMLAGKSREMGLGSFPVVSLAEVRQKAAEARKLLKQGQDPIASKRAAEAQEADEKARLEAEADRQSIRTFRRLAEAYLAAHGRSWSAVHAAQWPSTLKAYVYPTIGPLPASSVTREHVLQILRPIWTTRPETAARVRGRIERILDYAAVDDPTMPANPARAPIISLALGKQNAVVRHHPALAWKRVPEFVQHLRKRDGTSALMLEFIILTACRLSEARLALWSEFDLDTAIWIVPAARMKARQQHRVPLSARAVEILTALKPLATSASDYVFNGGKRGKPLSVMAVDMLQRRMMDTVDWKDRHGEDITAHGFRSSFREWCAEDRDVPRELAEMALAHRVAGVEGVYQRSDMFMRRRKLMNEWAAFCGSGEPVVVDATVGWPSQARS